MAHNADEPEADRGTEYLVAMEVTFKGVVHAYVEAHSPEEAAELCAKGAWDDMDDNGLELTDWKVAGKAEEN